MNLRSLILSLAGTALIVGCAPKKQPKPNVTASADAAVAAANEGAVAASPVSSGTTTGHSEAGAASLPVLGPAPAWKLKDVDGNAVSSDQFKGKVMVVDFWATWCPPCREEIPGYIDLYRKYGKDRLVIVGASVDEGGPAVVKAFIAKFGINYPVVMADEPTESAFGGMDAIPTTFLIDQNGQIRDKKVGAEPTADYEKKIQALLK